MITVTAQNIEIPALGYGTWQLRDQDCVKGVLKALETGYRHIDTAQIYENEAEVGTGIKQSGIQRQDIFLTTKVWMDRVGNGALQKSVEESLNKLQTDYVDLLLIHWPEPSVPFAEQMQALMEVQKAGKTKLIGVSNFTTAQLKEVTETLNAPVVTDQIEYHPFLTQKKVLEYLRSKNMFLTAYSPLARGKINDSPVLKEIGLKYGKNQGQITLRWLLQQGDVVAIPKAASEQNIKNNFDIFDFELSSDEMQKISALGRDAGRMVNPAWAPKWDLDEQAA